MTEPLVLLVSCLYFPRSLFSLLACTMQKSPLSIVSANVKAKQKANGITFRDSAGNPGITGPFRKDLAVRPLPLQSFPLSLQ